MQVVLKSGLILTLSQTGKISAISLKNIIEQPGDNQMAVEESPRYFAWTDINFEKTIEHNKMKLKAF